MIASRHKHLLVRPSLVRSNCLCALYRTGESIIPDVMRSGGDFLLSCVTGLTWASCYPVKKKQPEREAHSASPSHPRSATTAVPTAASRRSSSPAGYGSFPRQPRTRNPNPNPATMMPQSEKGRRSRTYLSSPAAYHYSRTSAIRRRGGRESG